MQLIVNRRFLLFVLLVLQLLAIVQNVYYWKHLPQRVATHFDIAGKPDAWMNKTSATLLMLGAQLGLSWLLLGIGRLLHVMPVSLINIPNREYWLSPERRDATLLFVQRFIAAIAISVSLLIMAINHLTFVANLRGQPLNLHAFGLLLALYFVGIAIMISALWKRFRRPM